MTKYYVGNIRYNDKQETAFCCAKNGARAKELLKEFDVNPTYFQTHWSKDVKNERYTNIAKDEEGVWLIKKRFSEDYRDYINIKKVIENEKYIQ